jgi:8-oxo-dGTP pyrophosphatase MutT (NUDIX family)/GNAT superfamily N-acetyltransferase
MAMSALAYSQLPNHLQPLLPKFYRAHNSRNRIRSEAICWVARRGDIVGGLCLTPVAQGHFLTGLLVTPPERNRGIGAQLVRNAVASSAGPVWLFCKPELVEFYSRLGFSVANCLPATLADRLTRYRSSKTLIALQNDQRMMPMPNATLNIAIACLLDDCGRILVVRKRGTRFFMLPGGKAELGETPLQTLRRELREELDLQLEDDDLDPLGHFQAQAANEPDHQVEADVFIARLPRAVTVQAELEEMAWLEAAPCERDDIAPLLRGHVMPALLARMAQAERVACCAATSDQGEIGSLAGKVSSIASSS